MNINETKQNNVVVLELEGKLDTTTAGGLESKLLQLIDSGETRLVIDFGGITYISSNGLRVLLVGAKKLSGTDGGLVLSSMKEQIKDVFDCAGCSSIFKIVQSKEEAVGSF